MKNRKALEAPAQNLQRKDKFITIRLDSVTESNLNRLKKRLEREIGQEITKSDVIKFAITIEAWRD